MKSIKTALIALLIGTSALSATDAMANNISISYEATGTKVGELVNSGAQRTRYEAAFGKFYIGFDRNYETGADKVKASGSVINKGVLSSSLIVYGKSENDENIASRKSNNSIIIGDFTSITPVKGLSIGLYGEAELKNGKEAKQFLSESLSGKLKGIGLHITAGQYGKISGRNREFDKAAFGGIDLKIKDNIIYTGIGKDLGQKIIGMLVWNGKDKGIIAIPEYDQKTNESGITVLGATGNINQNIYSVNSGKEVLEDKIWGSFLPKHYGPTSQKSSDGLVVKLGMKNAKDKTAIQTLLGYGFKDCGFAIGPEVIASKNGKDVSGVVVEAHKTGKVPLITTANTPTYSVEFTYNSNTGKAGIFVKLDGGF